MTATATPSARKAQPDVVLDRDREAPAGATGTIIQIPLELIDVDANVRKQIVDERIAELAASIAEHGVLQAISVRDIPGDRYAINYGQSRFLASKLAGKATIPAFVDNTERTPAQLAIHQLLENLHRADLNPLDRARAMREVLDGLGMTQAELARQLGIGESTVTNDVGILKAPAKVQEAVAAGQITPAHAKAIKGLSTADQEELLQEALDEHLTAHELEEAVQQHKEQAEWRASREAEDLDQARAAAERYEEKLRELVKKAPLDAPIRTSGQTWNDSGKAKLIALEEGLAGLGFTNVARGHADGRTKGFCDCIAWKVELGYNGGLSIAPACIVRAHVDAKYTADRKAEATEREFQDRVRGRVQELITEQALELFHRSPEAARIFLWISFDWSLNDWVRDHKGERKKPDAWDEISSLPEGELAVELAKYVRKGFTDRYNIKLDWPRLAQELGLNEPKPERAEKAPETPAYGQIVIDGETRYRISKVLRNGELGLAADGRQWRNNPVIAFADARLLTWDVEAKGWAGTAVAGAAASA